MTPDRICELGFAIAFPAMSGALPCAGSNSACSSPMLALPHKPSDPAPIQQKPIKTTLRKARCRNEM
eukprot:3609654-Rhodomonas_salina.3